MCQGHVPTKYHAEGQETGTKSQQRKCARDTFLQSIGIQGAASLQHVPASFSCVCVHVVAMSATGLEVLGPLGPQMGLFAQTGRMPQNPPAWSSLRRYQNVLLPKFDLRVIRRSKIVHFIHPLEMRYGQRLAVRLFEQK